jgi:hemerythrin-like domain-containing protein
MLEMLGDLKDDSVIKAEADIAEFQEFIKKHREQEEKNLYSRLDRELSRRVKEEIIARINEIPIRK